MERSITYVFLSFLCFPEQEQLLDKEGPHSPHPPEDIPEPPPDAQELEQLFEQSLVKHEDEDIPQSTQDELLEQTRLLEQADESHPDLHEELTLHVELFEPFELQSSQDIFNMIQ